jgi:hypothetical protein
MVELQKGFELTAPDRDYCATHANPGTEPAMILIFRPRVKVSSANFFNETAA